MQARLRYSAIAGWLVLVLGVLEAGVARPFGAQLTGRELLVQFAKRGGGMGVPGIYAVMPDGQHQRVAVHAAHPRWSPDRRRLAFLEGGTVMVASLAAHSTSELRPAELIGDVPPGLARLRARALWWTPDGTAVGGWQQAVVAPPRGPRQMDVAAVLPIVLPLDPQQPHRGLVPQPEADVGLFSQSADGALLAYEEYVYTPDIGAADRRLVIAELAGRTKRAFGVDGFAGGVWLNHRFAPRGRWLSADYLHADRTRSTVLTDLVTGEHVVLPPRGKYANWTAAVDWSPDGRYMLLASARFHGTDDLELLVEDLSEPAQPRLIRRVGTTSWPQQACWSPDSKQVAVIEGQSRSSTDGTHIVLGVFSLDGKLSPLRQASTDLYPCDLDW